MTVPSNEVLAIKIEMLERELAEHKAEIESLKAERTKNLKTGFAALLALVSSLGGFILYLIRGKLGI